MSYYYITHKNEFLDSSSPIEDTTHVRINELQYAITRMAVMGYSRKEIERAVKEVFEIIDENNRKS